MLRYAHPDLDGICRSPHDHPPKWAAMLTMYCDESLEADGGYAVVAGFIGTESQWNDCMRRWCDGLGSRPSLHMKDLRGFETDRHKDLLERLGRIPEDSGLVLVQASVRCSDYIDLVEGRMGEMAATGYLMATLIALSAVVQTFPDTERFELICEEQLIYAPTRAALLTAASKHKDWQTPDGLPRLAKWSSMAKSTILEPADYACYATLQNLRDPKSRRAQLCSPILRNRRKIGWSPTKEQVRSMFDNYMKLDMPSWPMSRDKKKLIRAAFKEVYGAH